MSLPGTKNELWILEHAVKEILDIHINLCFPRTVSIMWFSQFSFSMHLHWESRQAFTHTFNKRRKTLKNGSLEHKFVWVVHNNGLTVYLSAGTQKDTVAECSGCISGCEFDLNLNLNFPLIISTGTNLQKKSTAGFIGLFPLVRFLMVTSNSPFFSH